MDPDAEASTQVNDEMALQQQQTSSSYSSLLGKREADTELHEEEHEDEETEEDPSRLIPVAEEEQALVQCVGIEQCFDSWDDFHRAMEEYCATTHQPMRLRTSDSAKAVNSRAAKRNSLKEPIDESVGFVKKLYLCTHGVKTKPRGKGKRPRQHYRYMGCPAMIRACISERKPGDLEGQRKSKYVVRVVAQINRHNHRLSEHLFKSYSESRVVIDDELIVPTSQNRLKEEQAATAAATASVAPVEQQITATVHPDLEDPTLKTNRTILLKQLRAIITLIGSPMSYFLVMCNVALMHFSNVDSVGWIGTGIMGASMCGHLMNHGYELTVYNRTLSKCDGLREKGARVAGSPAEVAQNSDIVFIMVGYPSDVKSVVLDPDSGLLSRMKAGGIIVDMTTSSPALAKKIYDAAKLKGVSTLDAPVSGGDVGARDATLSVMVGGDMESVYVTMPFLSIMGKSVRHMGPAGAGQHTKMMNQILIATTMIGVVEGLLYAKKSGLDMDEAIRAVSAGAAGSWSISNMGPRIVKRDFDPGFFVEHFLKDMGIALKEAARMNLSLPGLSLAHQLYVAVKVFIRRKPTTWKWCNILESTDQPAISPSTEASPAEMFDSQIDRNSLPIPEDRKGERSSETKMVVAVKPRVGWIGTGVMGASMVGHILKHGYEVTVFNRTLSKCDSLKEQGATVASSPAEVAKVSDIVFGIVGYPSDVRKVFLDPEWGVLSSIKSGGVIVDMTTSEPSLAKEIYEAAKQKGVSSLDAPVSGGDVGAREGTLSIMVGGDAKTVESTMPLFEIMGKNIRHMGGAGAGQHTKMVNQILIATNMIGVVEGLLYAQKSGLDVEEAIRAVSAGAAGSWSISNLGPRIAKRNFDPGFFVEHFVKDMGIALKEAERMNLSLPGLALANQLYVAVKAQGHGRLGTQSLMLALEQLNGIDSN
ncbi:3-hydroxyisobutyrate dehydrogenase, NAD-binding domain [Phytophthora cactorum]|nr:3-hydroxyisobutyrate dehydrogenase, NAD-binding domain [Phytophthora cactorum]